MISRPLAFHRDRHWRELSPTEGKSRYRYEYLCEVPHRLDTNLNCHVQLRDKQNKLWVILDGHYWITQPGYQFNGCSPKRHLNFFNTGKPGWIGTPDFQGDKNAVGGTILSSGWHDQARQFSRTDFIKERFTLEQIDHGFYLLMKQCFFKQAELYYNAVRWASGWWPHHDDGQHSIILDV